MDLDDTSTEIVPLRIGPGAAAAALAAAAGVTLLIATSGVALPPNAGFLPAYGAATFCIDFISAVLLLAQARIVQDRARADLGRAYLFSALIIVPHMLSFPGVFAADPIIGSSGGAVWFWCAWHLGFPLFALFYLRAPRPRSCAAPIRIRRSVGLVVLVVGGLTTLFTAGLPLLPTILVGGSFQRVNTLGIGPAIIALNALCAVMARLRMRPNCSLSTCVFAALVISTIDVLLVLSGSTRFSLGWYVARVLSLVTGLVVLVALVSELLALLRQTTMANAQLRLLTATDPLTGIANRRQFDQTLDLEWRRATRSGQNLSLLMIDIDQFKPFNDHYGHPAGDLCLKQVAAALLAVPHRPADLVARIGGEEFAVLLPDTSAAGAMEVARALNLAVAAKSIDHVASTIGVVTCSIGVCADRPVASAGSAADLVAGADVALYEAKRNGRNQVRLIATTDSEPVPAFLV